MDNDPWLIGYFTDNEIRWVDDIRSKESQLEVFLKKAPDSPGYKRAMEFLKERGKTPETITFDDMFAFLEISAAQYGKVVYTAIRKYDKNHLILGSRFNSRAPLELTRALAPYYDVFSFNNYDHRAPIYKLSEITCVSGKPTMITEFSFKAMDSGLYNTIGAGDAVATQLDRATLFTNYVQDLARLPSCVGFYWFRYRDQPKQGAGSRSPGGWGGENSNYGIVKIDGTPWTILVDRMKEVNSTIEEIALNAAPKEKPFETIEQMPEFPGGPKALIKFLSENSKYSMWSDKVTIVKFLVTSKGKIDKIEIVRGYNPEWNKEIIRLLKMMPAWTPGRGACGIIKDMYCIWPFRIGDPKT